MVMENIAQGQKNLKNEIRKCDEEKNHKRLKIL